jgi:hypothetical protein
MLDNKLVQGKDEKQITSVWLEVGLILPVIESELVRTRKHCRNTENGTIINVTMETLVSFRTMYLRASLVLVSSYE